MHYHIGRPRDEEEGYLALHEDLIRSVVHNEVTALGGSITAEHGDRTIEM